MPENRSPDGLPIHREPVILPAAPAPPAPPRPENGQPNCQSRPPRAAGCAGSPPPAAPRHRPQSKAETTCQIVRRNNTARWSQNPTVRPRHWRPFAISLRRCNAPANIPVAPQEILTPEFVRSPRAAAAAEENAATHPELLVLPPIAK